jgi:hypothetical protein
MSTEHSEIMQALGRIEQKIDGHDEEDKAIHAKQDRAIDTLFTKTNELNQFRARVRGGMTAIGGLFAAVLALIGIDWGNI